FSLSTSKRDVMPMIRKQLNVLSVCLRQQHNQTTIRRLCALSSDLFQLSGEISLDANHYTDATQCYALAAAAAREARAFDLWACAMTRHAFVAVYDRAFDEAAPLLDLAAE